MTLNFPDAPADGDVYDNYQYDATAGVWNLVPSLVQARYVISPTAPESAENGDAWFNSVDGVTYIYYVDGDSAQWVQTGDPALGYLSVDQLSDTVITSPAAGEKLVFDGTNWVNLPGYQLVQTLYFTSSGTFTKADFPFLRAIRVKCVGGGGAGGGAQTTGSGEVSPGGGGRGGSFGESFITDIAGLAASVTVTRGAGGTGVAGGTGNGGVNSSFGALVVGGGGSGASAEPPLATESMGGRGMGSLGGAAGDLVIPGGAGETGWRRLGQNPSDFRSCGGSGGSSMFGVGGSFVRTSNNGFSGRGFGAGGGGSLNTQNQSTNRTGGAGTNGIVIVELFA